MKRVIHAVRLELRLQQRYRLIAVSVVIGALAGLVLQLLFPPDRRSAVLPAYFLFVVGGTAALYAAAQFLFDRDEGTLAALQVSPLRPAEYLAARTVALTLLMLLESAVVLFIAGRDPALNLPLVFAALPALAVLHILIGMIIIPGFTALTDALLPLTAVIVLLQLPALLLIPSMPQFPLLLMPSAGPLLLLQAATRPMEPLPIMVAGGLSIGWCSLAAWLAMLRFRRTVVNHD